MENKHKITTETKTDALRYSRENERLEITVDRSQQIDRLDDSGRICQTDMVVNMIKIKD